ncbi:MAG: AAA family ATPase [Bacteroidetes bacterium]|nr:MAG: AAA family ATPase [Bacteroidota bacterium]
MDNLRQKFYAKYAQTQTETVRDYINIIDWSNRFIGIKGGRGVGKTTLVLQYIKMHYPADNTILYVSLDDLYFSENSFYQLADEFYKKGGELLAVDEVHRYPNWAIELKNIYDDMPDLKVIFTGSSLLHLQKAKADLSRRAVMYNMKGLSFREFLNFESGHIFKKYSLEDILENHIQIAIEIKEKIKVLAYFENYLNYGYYPFYKENILSYHSKLQEIILTILEVDIPQFASIQTANIIYLKKLLKIISQSVPFKPNMNVLSSRTGISLNTMKQYIKLLYEADLLRLLYTDKKGINSLNKPEKIYLSNTNLMYNQGDENVNFGNLREVFFYSQLDSFYNVTSSKDSDFLVENKFTFEIGGKNKDTKQIKGLPNSFLVKDDIEIGVNNSIPLWLFGFLY